MSYPMQAMGEHIDHVDKLAAIARLKELGAQMDTHADHLGKMQGDRPHLGM
jgi:hypothetical protein